MKLSTSDLDAFTSPNLPPLLTMGINIEGKPLCEFWGVKHFGHIDSLSDL